MTERALKTFLEVLEWSGPMMPTTSIYEVDSRQPRSQKVESYVLGFRYFDAKSLRGKRQNVSCTYYVKGRIMDVKDIPSSDIIDRDKVFEAMNKLGVKKIVYITRDIVQPFYKGDIVLKKI